MSGRNTLKSTKSVIYGVLLKIGRIFVPL